MAGKTKKDKNTDRARRQRELRHWLIDEGVWMVAQWELYQLFTQRKEILADYVKTEGHTDWVWLEEGLSVALDDLPQYGESNADEQHAMYIAAFILVYNAVRAVYPLVRPPTWLLPEMALLAGVKNVPKDTAEVVRDMLLQGRDAEAMLLMSELAEGPFIVWRDGFFRDHAERRRTRVGADLLLPLPPNSFFYVSSLRFEGSANQFGIRDAVFDEPSLNIGDATAVGTSATAIGWAMRLFAEYQQTLVVQIVLVSGDQEDRAEWNNEIVFAITNDAGDAEMIGRMMRPESENAP